MFFNRFFNVCSLLLVVNLIGNPFRSLKIVSIVLFPMLFTMKARMMIMAIRKKVFPIHFHSSGAVKNPYRECDTSDIQPIQSLLTRSILIFLNIVLFYLLI